MLNSLLVSTRHLTSFLLLPSERSGALPVGERDNCARHCDQEVRQDKSVAAHGDGQHPALPQGECVTKLVPLPLCDAGCHTFRVLLTCRVLLVAGSRWQRLLTESFQACWNLGIPSGDFFIVSDLYQKKSMPQVCELPSRDAVVLQECDAIVLQECELLLERRCCVARMRLMRAALVWLERCDECESGGNSGEGGIVALPDVDWLYCLYCSLSMGPLSRPYV
jgi:hypothetical protein